MNPDKIKCLKNFIYLDNNATSPLHTEVQEFLSDFNNLPLNASSPHSLGNFGFSILEEARYKVLNMLQLDRKEYDVIFTSSGTEANNLIISSFLRSEIVISSIEHPSILAFAESNKKISSVKIDADGYLDLNDLEVTLHKFRNCSNAKLLSFIYAHNETGVIQKYYSEIIQIARNFDFLVHSDMSQCPGRVMLGNLSDFDYITLSSHKIGGPIGAGALIRKKKCPIFSMLIGGGQENNIRSGTENILAIAGFGEISKIISQNCLKMIDQLSYLRNFLEQELTSQLPHIRIIHQNSLRISNTSFFINLLRTAEIQIIEMDLEKIAISSGSACNAKKNQINNIISNSGYDSQIGISGIRISLSTHNNLNDIKVFLEKYCVKNKNIS